MKPMDEHKETLANATAFKHENPDEKPTTCARIFHVNPSTVRGRIRREKLRASAPLRQRGGHNKVLLESQVVAIYKYIENSYLQGFGATKSMVFAAIGFLKKSETPLQKLPSWR